jgi:hypothetical protein
MEGKLKMAVTDVDRSGRGGHPLQGMVELRFKPNYDSFFDFGSALKSKTGMEGDPEALGRRWFNESPFKGMLTITEAINPDFAKPDPLLGIDALDLNAAERSLEGSPSFAHLPENILKNIARLPLQALRVINSPIESGKQLSSIGTGAIEESFGPAQTYLRGVRPSTDPDIATFREAVEGTKNMFTADQMVKNPLDLPATLSPLLGTIGRLGKVLPAGSGTSRLGRFVEDPGMGMLTEGVRGGVEGGRFLARKLKELRRGEGPPDSDELITSRRRRVRDFEKADDADPSIRLRDVLKEDVPKIPRRIQDLKKAPIKDALRKFGDMVLGVTTGTSDLVQKIIREAPDKGKSRRINAFRLGGLRAKEATVRAGHKAVDRAKAKIDEFQQMARNALEPHMRTGIESEALANLKNEARLNLREAGAILKGERKLGLEERRPEQIDIQRATTPSGVFPGGQKDVPRMYPTGEVDISFEQYPSTRASAISPRGTGQELIIDFHERVITSPPTTVGAAQSLIWEIDDVIDVLESDIGAQARRTMVKLRDRVRDTVADQLGVDVYNEMTRQYEIDRQFLFNAEIELNLAPGKISKSGIMKDVNRDATLNAMLSAMDSADEFAYDTLQELERRSGGTQLQERLVGVASQAFFGGNLVNKSAVIGEVRQAFSAAKNIPGAWRMAGTMGIMGMSYSMTGFVLGIPLSAVYSPRMIAKWRLEIQPRYREFYDKYIQATKNSVEMAAALNFPASKLIQKGITIDQFLDRAQHADWDVRLAEYLEDQPDLSTPIDEEQDSILKTTAGIPIGQ